MAKPLTKLTDNKVVRATGTVNYQTSFNIYSHYLTLLQHANTPTKLIPIPIQVFVYRYSNTGIPGAVRS